MVGYYKFFILVFQFSRELETHYFLSQCGQMVMIGLLMTSLRMMMNSFEFDPNIFRKSMKMFSNVCKINFQNCKPQFGLK